MRAALLGIDYGTKQVGLAWAELEPEHIRPLKVVPAAKGAGLDEILGLESENAELRAHVLGLPLSDSGEETEMSEKVRGFARRLSRRSKLPVILFDEYASSVEAEERLSGRRAAGKRVDDAAAALILESFLSCCDIELSISSGRAVLKSSLQTDKPDE